MQSRFCDEVGGCRIGVQFGGQLARSSDGIEDAAFGGGKGHCVAEQQAMQPSRFWNVEVAVDCCRRWLGYLPHCFSFYSCCFYFYISVCQVLCAVSILCYALLVFDDVPDEELAEHQAQIAAGSLTAARRIASAWLASGPGVGLDPNKITDTLIRRDVADPQYVRLAPFERRWAVLVIRLLRGVMDPTPAVADAHLRGASWADIGAALGIARITAYKRFSNKAPQ